MPRLTFWAWLLGNFTIISIFSFLGRYAWWLDLFSHFRLQYILLALLLLTITLVKRNRWLALWASLLFCIHTVDYCTLYQLRAINAPTLQPNLRVMAYNVYYDNKEYDKIIDSIRHEAADIVYLAEAENPLIDHLQGLKDIYPYQYPIDAKRNWFGAVLLSRFPWQAFDVIQIPNAGGKFYFARFQHTHGMLNVIGLHALSPMSKARDVKRNAQLASIASFVSRLQGNTIVMGDHNVSPWSPIFRDYITVSGLHPALNGIIAKGTWPTFLPVFMRFPIDHVLVSNDIQIVQQHVGDPAGSDHAPNIVDMVLPTVQRPAAAAVRVPAGAGAVSPAEQQHSPDTGIPSASAPSDQAHH